MPDPFGQLITRWTVRLALSCYLYCLAAVLLRGRTENAQGDRTVRVIWTLGCGIFVAHVIAAFAYYHHFSHQAAYDDTAKQTEELIGFAFGGGIYFSYLFLVLWVGDAAWRWISPASRPAWLDWPLHAYMFFIAFNGAIVFEGGVSRVAGIVGCVLLLGIVFWRLTKPRPAGA